MKNIIKTMLVLLFTASLSTFATANSSGGYSEWIKAKRIKTIGKKLKRENLIPFDIQCKRAPGGKVWYNTLFRVRMVPQSKTKITTWRMRISKEYETNGKRPQSKFSQIAYRPAHQSFAWLCAT
ncbi:MAG: hypothetical protein AB8B49_09675 [Nitratireductor sp.]